VQLTEPLTFRDRTSFVGRARERERLEEDLKRGVGLLTIVGPSGMGKTRLAATVGSDLVPNFRDEGGVWFCSLATCGGAADVEALIARTLGFSDWEAGKLDLALARRGRTLLILDNGEQIAAELGGLVSPWLERCPALQLLVTSIVPLEIVGETRLDLGPLTTEDAVALYLDRAHQAAAGRTLEEAELAIVEELVCRLDRIPLAIELAAARVRVLPPRALLSRISSRMKILRSSTPGRHGSWLEALNLTWDLLTPAERTILSRAAVFAGSFSYEAAVEILAEEAGDGQLDVLDLLDSLRGKALLQLDEGQPAASSAGGRDAAAPADLQDAGASTSGQSPRFSLLDSIRSFAEEKLDGPETARLLERHATYFVEMGERELAGMDRSNEVETIRALVAERENLEQILRRCGETLPHLAARAGLILYDLSSICGFPPSEGSVLEGTVRTARRAKDGKLLARALGNRAAAFAQSYRTSEAALTMEDALAAAREVGDEREEMLLLLSRTTLLLRAGEEAAALAKLEVIADWGRERGEPLVEGLALLRSAMIHIELEDPVAAEVDFEAAQAILRRHGTVHSEAHALRCLAGLHYLRGRYREARQTILTVQRRVRMIGNHLQASNDSLALGMFAEGAGQLDEAERHLGEALHAYRQMANQRGVGFSLAVLGTIALKQGRWKVAEERFVESVAELEAAGDLLRRARILPYLALVEARAGRLIEAEQSIREAQGFLTEVRGPSALKIAGLLEGCVLLARARALQASGRAGAEALANDARTRAEALRGRELSPTAAYALELLEADLADWARGSERREISATRPLRVGPDVAWFELGDGERIDISRRATLRGMLRILVERRLENPGLGTHALDLFSFGWPKEKIDPETALKRVYIGVWTLRGLGLAEILMNRADGYLLDPSVPLIREPA